MTGIDFVHPDELVSLIDYVASNLALCIANLSTQLDVDLMVIGGITAEVLGEPLIKAIQNYVSQLFLLNTIVQFQSCKEPGVVGYGIASYPINWKRILTD